ncbi:MAG: ketoreductase [Acidobacteria bacterium]|nr:MAG: ketoreductase [Acidobacteriota bacterium]
MKIRHQSVQTQNLCLGASPVSVETSRVSIDSTPPGCAPRVTRVPCARLPPMSFADKTIIVTGATSGIGRAAARAFGGNRGSVVVVGRQETELAEVVREVRAAGGQAVPCVADVTSEDAPARIVAAALEMFRRIDVLVNAAGIIAAATLEATTDELWDSMMAINLRAPFRLMRAAAPHLTERKGSVVNVSSVNGLRSFPGVLAYCVSKAGVDHLTRCAAIEMAPLGVRVNAVNPGVTVTNLHRRSGMQEEQYAAFLERSKTTHPLGRPGNADEIADLIVFLASERAGWMTGETIPIDGGRHLTCAR